MTGLPSNVTTKSVVDHVWDTLKLGVKKVIVQPAIVGNKAIVKLSDGAHASLALALDGSKFFGRPIQVSLLTSTHGCR